MKVDGIPIEGAFRAHQVPILEAPEAVTFFNRELQRHHDYIREHLKDMPEIRNWSWTSDFRLPIAPPPLAKKYPRKYFTDS